MAPTGGPEAPAERSRQAAKRRRAIPTWAVVVGGSALLLGVVAFLGRGDRGPVAPTASGADTLAHVHGLGVNPADGSLYAATHYGLFRVPADGKAERVGDAVQDTMGFTVVGPDHFLGSGHPDPADRRLRAPGKPPLLGLIESTDGGRTWDPVSLLGDADFHSLVAAHGLIYGYDSTNGRLLVSADGERWETRSQLGLGDFAVDPADPGHLVATTERGLAESVDGGRNWSPIAGPQLAFLSWNRRQGLWGVDPSGQTYQRVGDAWQPRNALPGRPQALLVADNELYAAADDGGSSVIYVSRGGGDTWRERYRDPAR